VAVVAVVLGSAAVVVGVRVVAGGGGSPAARANLWVDAGGGSCTRQAAPGSWVDREGCSSFAAACSAAAAGDVVRVKNGTYPGQTLGTDCGGTAEHRITFDAEEGASGCRRQMTFFTTTTTSRFTDCPVALTGGLTIQGHDLNVADLSSGGALDFPQSTSDLEARVTATNIHSRGFSANGTDIVLRHGEVGGLWVCSPSNGGTSGPWTQEDLAHIGFDIEHHSVLRITVDGYLFHDLYDISAGKSGCGNPEGPHTDCLQIAQGDSITVKNSQFWNCATSDIQSNDDFGPPYTTLRYVGNFFGKVYTGGNGAEIGSGTPGTSQADDCNGTNVVAYNTFSTGGAGNQVCADTGTFVIEGNLVVGGTSVVLWSDAGSGPPVIDHNVWTSGSLGTNSRTCSPRFTGVNSALDGLHLSASDTCARDAGKPGTTIVVRDIDRATRGSPPEAGADEIGTPADRR